MFCLLLFLFKKIASSDIEENKNLILNLFFLPSYFNTFFVHRNQATFICVISESVFSFPLSLLALSSCVFSKFHSAQNLFQK